MQQIQIFSIPAFGNDEKLDEMNRFLRGHKIVDVKKKLIIQDGTSYWTFCVKYIYSQKKEFDTQGKRSKVDYREILDEATFTVFSKLREIRKEMALQNGVPIYAIFKNKELADIASLGERTIEEMKKIDGIGEKKLKKYGDELLRRYEAMKK